MSPGRCSSTPTCRNFFTDTQTQRLVTLTAPQIEELKKAPSTKANRQLIATADNFGPTHQAYHKVSWPDSVPVIYVVSDKTPFDGSPQDAQAWRDAAAAFTKAGPDRTLVIAKGSSHDVPQDKPALVLNEIEQMTATVKYGHSAGCRFPRSTAPRTDRQKIPSNIPRKYPVEPVTPQQ